MRRRSFLQGVFPAIGGSRFAWMGQTSQRSCGSCGSVFVTILSNSSPSGHPFTADRFRYLPIPPCVQARSVHPCVCVCVCLSHSRTTHLVLPAVGCLRVEEWRAVRDGILRDVRYVHGGFPPRPDGQIPCQNRVHSKVSGVHNRPRILREQRSVCAHTFTIIVSDSFDSMHFGVLLAKDAPS